MATIKKRVIRRAEPITIRLSVRATIRLDRLSDLEENEGKSRTALIEESIRLLANRFKVGNVTEDEISDWLKSHKSKNEE
jgi:hypothetical protein